MIFMVYSLYYTYLLVESNLIKKGGLFTPCRLVASASCIGIPC
ncbi:hypothetical protein EVA_09255 [gut metagenome]|uniref:Uncharacterized protein n=1 Tax=gut metagenome TaxID=749906 RepID=J9GRA5_9ZZZZ